MDSDTQKIKKIKLGPVPTTIKTGNLFTLKNSSTTAPALIRFLVAV